MSNEAARIYEEIAEIEKQLPKMRGIARHANTVLRTAEDIVARLKTKHRELVPNGAYREISNE